MVNGHSTFTLSYQILSKVKFELHVYMKCIEFYFVVVLSPTLHIDHPSKNQSMTIVPGTNTSQAIVNIPSSTSGNKTVCVDVIEAQNGYVIIILNKYSGTCSMRHLGFLTSSDIQQKFMVPKCFC
jgi:hypothetical protein